MTKILAAIYVLIIPQLANSQTLIAIHHLDSSSPVERLTNFDINNDFIAYGLRPSVTAINGNSLMIEDSTTSIFVLLSTDHIIQWTLELSPFSAQILDAQFVSDGIIVCGSNPGNQEGFLNNIVLPNNAFFLYKFDFNGELIWQYEGLNQLRLTEGQIEVDLNDNIYLAGRIVNNENGELIFGSDTIESVALDSQFPDNVCLLKFDASGSEVWARVLPSSDTGYFEQIEVDMNSNVYVSGHFESITAEGIEFGEQIITEGKFVISLSSEGEERWAINIPDFEEWNQNLTQILQILLVNDNLFMTLCTSADSILLDGAVLRNPCLFNDRFSVLAKYNSQGILIGTTDLICLRGDISNYESLQKRDSDLFALLQPTPDQTFNEVELGSINMTDYIIGLDANLNVQPTSLLFQFENGDSDESRIMTNESSLFYTCQTSSPFVLNGETISDITQGIYILQFGLNTSIFNSATSEKFILFPNPVQETLHILADEFHPGDPYFIISSSGSLVSHGTMNSIKTINVSDLSPGVYLLGVKDQVSRFNKQ